MTDINADRLNAFLELDDKGFNKVIMKSQVEIQKQIENSRGVIHCAYGTDSVGGILLDKGTDFVVGALAVIAGLAAYKAVFSSDADKLI